jgi:uncharacterized membrane protein
VVNETNNLSSSMFNLKENVLHINVCATEHTKQWTYTNVFLDITCLMLFFLVISDSLSALPTAPPLHAARTDQPCQITTKRPISFVYYLWLINGLVIVFLLYRSRIKWTPFHISTCCKANKKCPCYIHLWYFLLIVHNHSIQFFFYNL